MKLTTQIASESLLLLLLCLAGAVHADEDVWKSGLNQYIKITDQERSATLPNQHPVSLNPQEITNALNTLEVWDKKGFMGLFRKSEEQVTVFSAGQATTLGVHLANALRQAKPDEDIVFVLARNEKGFLNIRDTTYTGARAFYVNDRLNIIIGDFAKPGDKFQERAAQSSGIEEIRFFFNHGRRAKVVDFDRSVITKPGLAVNEVGGKVRLDWLLIDVPAASAFHLAEIERNREPTGTVTNAALQRETARLAEERRELRAEMARMRKEMKEGSGGDERSVEERLATLKQLYDDKLISKEEYDSKRQEILGDI